MDVVFSEAEMITCTPCGQASKLGVEPRPALPSNGMEQIYSKYFPGETCFLD